jgi:hypothetical protein
MGIYIRKSVSFGPFRFNLSKSGVGLSVGVPGFRVGMSPRGNYIHMGRGRLYYRATLPRTNGRRPRAGPPPEASHEGAPVALTEIESSDAATIVDSSSADLVAEMNAKRKKLRLWPLVLIAGGALALCVGKQTNAVPWVPQAILVLTLLAAGAAAFYDRLRKTTVLLYDLDIEVAARCEQLQAAFEALGSCGRRWHVSASGPVHDRKYHAGASSLVNRKTISIGTRNPPYVKSNVESPSLPVGKQTLYFFPDKVLVFESSSVGAVSYRQLDIRCIQQQFIESGSVPHDAQVIGSTWRYVNKKGGPDKRFKDNRQLPIALYEEITFRSSTGLDEMIKVSRVGLGDKVAAAIKALVPVTE